MDCWYYEPFNDEPVLNGQYWYTYYKSQHKIYAVDDSSLSLCRTFGFLDVERADGVGLRHYQR